MVKYMIISPTHNVDLKRGITTVTVLCKDPASNEFYWAEPKEADPMYFSTRARAELYININKLVGAFSYGIVA